MAKQLKAPFKSSLAKRANKGKSANIVIADGIRGHAFDLLKASNGTRKKVVLMLQDLEKNLAAELARQTPSTLNKERRMREFLAGTQETIASAYRDIKDTVTNELIAVAEISSLFAGQNINSSVGVAIIDTFISKKQAEIIASDTLIQGAPSLEWWERQAGTVADMFADQVRQGALQGDTLQQLAQRVKGGIRDGAVVPGVPDVPGVTAPGRGFLTRATKNAEALVRTSYMTVANEAHFATYQENEDILQGIQQISTLDNRTTLICMAYSGACWDLEKNPINGNKLPYGSGTPRHWGAIAKGGVVITKKGPMAIENVGVGDEVLTHCGRFKRVYATMKKRNELNVIRVMKTESGATVRLTNCHPVLILRGGKLLWARVDSIKSGDQLFHHIDESVPVGSLGVTVSSPKGCPTEIPEEDVTFDISLGEVVTSSAVYFNDDPAVREGEVADIGANNKLSDDEMLEVLYNLKKFRLSLGRHAYLLLLNSLGVCEYSLSRSARVVFDHAVRTILVMRACLLRQSISPMALASKLPGGMKLFDDLACGISSVSDDYSMLPTPSGENGFAKSQFSLYLPDGFSESEMLFSDEIIHKLPVFEVDEDGHKWLLSRVTDIGIVAYGGEVYNLAVDDDESYVVNGVIVHNCRSIETPLLKSMAEIFGIPGLKDIPDSTRASIDGQIPEDMTFDKWLDGKDREFQDTLLGSGRGKMFREGKIDLVDLVDQRTGGVLTLDELRASVEGD